MCGRYTHLLTWRELVEFSRLVEPPGGAFADNEITPEPAEFKKRYNHAPTENSPVVRIKGGRRELVILRWGWGKMKVTPREWINARAPRSLGHLLTPSPSACAAALSQFPDSTNGARRRLAAGRLIGSG
jgi:putative SOS response-associated peptidase YedK